MDPQNEEWKWEPDTTQSEGTAAQTPATPEPTAQAPVTPPVSPPIPPVVPPYYGGQPPVAPQNPYRAPQPYGQPYTDRPPVYAVPAPPPHPVYTPPAPAFLEETDPQKPLWQAVIGPLLPMERKQTQKHRRPLWGWGYGLAALMAVYMSTAALDFRTMTVGAMEFPRVLFFLPLHLVMGGLSLYGFFRLLSRQQLREQVDTDAYNRMEAAGRQVTVYCDRIEAVGLHDTVTVPFAGAVLRESRDVLTVEKDSACVAVRSADLTTAEVTALTAILYPRVADRRGKEAFFSYRPTVQRRPAPVQKQEPVLLTAAFTRSASKTISRRVGEVLGKQGLMWLPLTALCALMLTNGWANDEYLLLYYIITLLAVLLLVAMIQITAVMWDVRTDRRLPLSGQLRFYNDRLELRVGHSRRAFRKEQVQLYLDEESLTVAVPGERVELPLSDFENPAALRGFLGQ